MPRLFWLDLETTGLVPQKHTILELAIGESPFHSPMLLVPAAIIERVAAFSSMHLLDDFIFNMHTKNGLLADCARSTLDFHTIEEELLGIVPDIIDRKEKPILCGSSVHFDHEMLKVHMPILAARFSHHHLDVSAIKLDCQTDGMAELPKAEAHRAKDDILESRAHYQLCKNWRREQTLAEIGRLGG